MEITFREYTDADKDLLQSFIEKLQDYVVTTDPIQRIRRLPGFGPVAVERTLKSFHNNHGKIYFAVDNGREIGYVFGFLFDKQSEENLLEVVPTKVGQVDDLYIDEEYRGQGIGKMLLQKIEEYFKDQGCDSVWMEVFASNTNAHNAYLKLGYMDREIGMLKKLL